MPKVTRLAAPDPSSNRAGRPHRIRARRGALRPDGRGRLRLMGADLRRANLTRAQLAGPDLESVNLGWASMPSAQLERADLTDADLREAGLAETNREGAVLVRAFSSGSADGERIPQARVGE